MCKLKYFCLLVFCGLLWSCNSEKKVKITFDLNKNYKAIGDIKSMANCTSPFGNYTTKLESNADGSILFFHEFEDTIPAFNAEVINDSIGYVLIDNYNQGPALSKENIALIRGHDLHRMQSNPEFLFGYLKFSRTLDNGLELFMGKDMFENEVVIGYDRSRDYVHKIEMKNPINTSELIEIQYSNWVESKYGQLAKHVTVIQAGRDTFQFDFETLFVNKEYIIP